MDWNLIIAVAIAALGLANTWLVIMVTFQRNDVKDLRKTDAQLVEQVAQIRELVAGRYLTREEFSQRLSEQNALLLGRMDALSNQISGRAT